MSSLKRKDAPGGNPPAKSSKSTKEARPSKTEGHSKDAKPASKKDAPAKDPVVSMLKDDEPMFPRGGGSVLTPLEQKKIQLEAKADAKREEEFQTSGKAQKKKKRKTALKTTEQKSGKKGGEEEEEDNVRIESLNFKKLVKGSLVLGQVTKINNLDLEIALPNNLTGHVSIVSISEQLTEKLQSSAEQDEGKDEDASDDDDSDVDLASIFSVGQYLRVYVQSTMDDTENKKGRRKIELSLKPAETNSGFEKDDVVPNSTVMASVSSVEDRGFVMETGIAKMGGFLSRSEVDPAISQERLQPGAVFLCHVISKGKIAQLSLKQSKIGNVKSVPLDATTIKTFLPGTTVDVLISNIDRRGLSGKILGHLDVTADIIHSGAGPDIVDLEEAYKVGSRVKARVICNFPAAREPKLGISLLPHVTALEAKLPGRGAPIKKLPIELLPISSKVEKCTVRHVETEMGLFVDVGIPGMTGFVHISRVKDGKVDALYESSGPFQVGSTHDGRVIGYNEMDGIFQLSFQKTVLEQEYLRLQDVPIGAVVTCSIEKVVINENGVGGLILKIAEGITGFVADRHLADVRLQHPEKKFREGMKVKARVLSVDLPKRQMRLTLKKTLVNSDAAIIKSFEDAEIGMQVPGTIINIQPRGAFIQFFGSVKGFLPLSEMSEAYIRDPQEHFRVGQVVSVHVLDVDAESKKLIVSCKDPSAFGLDKQTALKNLKLGDLVSAKVSQKTEDQIFVELADSGLKAVLPIGHLTDKSASKNQFASKRINVGQTLSGLMVLEKNDSRRSIILTQKPSFVNASKSKALISTFEEAKQGMVVPGFVRNITATAVFVQFAGTLHALLPKSRLSAEVQSQPDFGMYKYQSIEVKIVSVIPDARRIMVAPADQDEEDAKPKEKKAPAPADDLSYGVITQAKVTSIKETQLNVQIANTQVQGRIDVSQIFDKWEDIPDPKDPLDKFYKKQSLQVRVMGVHDAKDHRFLPFSHRSAHSVLELSAKQSDFKTESPEPLAFDKIKVGDTHIAFVNNVTPQYLWVNLSPTVRGRITALEASDGLSQLNDLEANFPVGSALKVRVTAVDAANNHLNLSARSSSSETIAWSALKPNMVLPGKVTKVNERQVLVKLSELVSGPIHLADFADDYDDVNTLKYKKGDIVRVAIVEIDQSNKRLRLSTRPSRIMSSTLPVLDKEISDVSQVNSGDIVRGFVKNVSDKGLFVLLGGQVTAMVKISNLSDRYIKEWKDQFQIDQLVKGRVIAVDAVTRHVELSLKSSAVDQDYTPPITFSDIKQGQTVTGKIRKVQDFGAFILVDNSANVSGLCHRSQMAEKPVQDATKLYKEGDAVKARVLEVDTEKRRITFGLKPSLFEDEDTDMEDSDAGAALEDESDEDDDMEDGNAMIEILGTDNVEDSDDEDEDEDEDDDEDDDEDEDEDSDEDEEMESQLSKQTKGLAVGKKSDWSADPFGESESESENDQPKAEKSKKKKRSKDEALVDKTAQLDANGPQTSSDYERLLLGQSDSSELWIAYMAFQMQVSELSKAREVAERAIKTINIREEAEKLNVWVAYLNLEVAYGTKQTVEEVFKRACQYNDEQEVHERLASIYIQSEKLKEADELFEAMVKKFGAKSLNVWMNYAQFLHATRNDPARARSLLPRATQQLGQQHQQNLVSRFAALEFRCGEPERGRTMFESLLAAWPKKGDLWSQLLDLEIGISGDDADATAVRDVFERRTRVKGLKKKQAESWFRRWAAWEQKQDTKGAEKVMAKASEWAKAFKARKEAEAAAEDEEMEE